MAAALIAAPAAIFYIVLAVFALNLPLYDDYDAGLAYLNHTVQLPTLGERLQFLLAAQQNEYKIVFGHAIFWLQHSIFAHIDFRLTCAIGDVLVLLIAWVLWKMFLPRERDLPTRLMLALPAALVLFQLNYDETLNWPLPALQNIGVVAWALWSLYLLRKGTTRSYIGALLMLLLAIASSGNGFLLVPVGLLMLLLERRYLRIVGWLAATVVCIAGYAYHYNVMSSQSPAHHSVFETIRHMRPLYSVAFFGAAALPAASAFVLGTLLLGYFVWMTRRDYWRRNPLIGYCVLFVLLTGIGVAGIRSEFGLWQATSSRYRIYCDLLVVFAWISFVEEFLERASGSLLRDRRYMLSLAAALLFFLGGNALGLRLLIARDRDAFSGMVQFERSHDAESPVVPLPNSPPGWASFQESARQHLIESIRLGVYTPPPFDPAHPGFPFARPRHPKH